MGKVYMVEISWKNIDIKRDHIITYLLYKEGKSIPLIAKIRKMTVDEVNHQLILAKSEIYSKNKREKSMLEKMLEIPRSNRKEVLSNLTPEEKINLAKEIYYDYSHIDHPEDKMVVIWIIGELKIKKLLGLIYKDIKHPHGNIRRMVCSAINKTGDKNSIEYLHRALMDSKPQVRQYAAKALGRLGDEKTIKKLKGLIENANEKYYVKKAFYQALEDIKKRIGNF